jgi:hypothetical protein
VAGLALCVTAVVAAVSLSTGTNYETVVAVPVRDEFASVGQRARLPASAITPDSRNPKAPLLPTGADGLLSVAERTALKLDVDRTLVLRSVTVEDSDTDAPSFLAEDARPRRLLIRATTRTPRFGWRLADTFAREYVGYRTEVIAAEAETAVAALRARAAILQLSARDSAEARMLVERTDAFSIGLKLDAELLDRPASSAKAQRRIAPDVLRNVAVGALLGLLTGLLASQIARFLRSAPSKTRPHSTEPGR